MPVQDSLAVRNLCLSLPDLHSHAELSITDDKGEHRRFILTAAQVRLIAIQGLNIREMMIR